MNKVYLTGNQKERIKILLELGFRKKDAENTVKHLEKRTPAKLSVQ